MSFAAFCMLAVSKLTSDSEWLNGWSPVGLVEAELDETFENDDVYAEYIKSARLQQALAASQNRQRDPQLAFTLDKYLNQKRRKLAGSVEANATIGAKELQQLFDEMHSGDKDPDMWLNAIPSANWTDVPYP